ncbi:MAG: hypothetical protein H0V25_11685 [Solirubrobacterales bacterium]|nr:hypothetical protein [Solirubrobacterales bacterium]
MRAAAKRRLTFANVLSVIAVFVALGGTAAAFQLGRNSVGTKQLKPNAVTSAKVKSKSLKGSDIDQPSLKKVRAGNVRSVRLKSNCSPQNPFPSGVSASHPGMGTCVISFPRSIANCDATATIDIRNAGLIVLDNPSLRIVRSASAPPTDLGVETFSGGGSLSNLPFDLVLVC